MDRRGFIKRLTASVAAFTAVAGGGVTLAARPAAKSLTTAKKAPQFALTADTSKFEKALGEAGRAVVEQLKKCRVVHVEDRHSAGELRRFSAIFKAAGATAPQTELDRQAWQMVEHGRLIEVTVTATQDDIIDLNRNYWHLPPGLCEYEIEATWLVFPS